MAAILARHKLKFIFIIVLIACINCVLSLLKMGYARAKMENYQLELTEAKVNSLHFAKRKERGLVLMKGLIKCTQKLHIGVKCNAIVTVVLSSESLSKREVKNSSSFLYFSCCIY